MRKASYLYSDVNAFWGDKMPMMAMEEMAELTQAISKVERKGLSEDLRKNVIEEIGDVYISIRAIMERYDITEEEIGVRVDTKLNKIYY